MADIFDTGNRSRKKNIAEKFKEMPDSILEEDCMDNDCYVLKDVTRKGSYQIDENDLIELIKKKLYIEKLYQEEYIRRLERKY